MKNDVGESSASINRRADDEAWPRILELLQDGYTLVYDPGINRCYTVRNDPGRDEGRTISATRVRRLEREGVLRMVGIHRYALVEGAQP